MASQGSVYRRSDGRWVAQVVLGKRRTYLYAKTRAEARQKLRAAIRASEDGRPHTAAHRTVDELLTAWLDVKAGTVAPTTLQLYRYTARKLSEQLGPLPIAELSASTIERTYAGLRNQLAPETVRCIHAAFALAIRTALRWGWLPADPLIGVTTPRAGRPRQNPLSLAETRALLEESTADRYHALWHLLASTGCTIGEATALSWRHVDLTAQTASIQRVCCLVDGRTTIRETTKTQSRRRRITMPDDTTAALHAHRARQLAEKLATRDPDWNPENLVFCTMHGGPVSNNGARDALRSALSRAGLPMIRIHDLRHTFASLALAAGTHPKVVQEKLGHSSIVMTLNRYSHVMEAQHREADAVMSNLLSSAQPAAPDAVSGAVNGEGKPTTRGAS